MYQSEREAYLRALAAASAIQSGKGSDANSWSSGPPQCDVREWRQFVSRAATVADGGAACPARTWTRVMCLWIECCIANGCGAADASQCQWYCDEFIPMARDALQDHEHSRIDSALRASLPSRVADRDDTRYYDSGPSPQLAFAVARCTDAMHKDVLQVTWDFFNPKTAGEIVMRRLQLLGPILSDAPVTTDSTLPARGGHSAENPNMDATDENPNRTVKVHVNCLEPLRSLLVAKTAASAAGPGTELPPCESACVEGLLRRVAYDVVTKLDCGIIENGYYAIPLLMDFYECVSVANVQSAMQSEVQAIQAVISAVFTRQLSEALADYDKSVVHSKSIVAIPGSPAKVSAVALSVLGCIVEPALNVLRRYSYANAPATEATKPGAALHLRELADTLQKKLAVWVREAWTGWLDGERAVSAKLAQRAQEDLAVIVTYIEHGL